MTDFVFNAIGGIFIVLFILVSVACIVEAYLENKEKDKRREKMAQGKDGDEDMRKSDWYMAKYKELKGSPGIRHKIFRRKGKRRRT